MIGGEERDMFTIVSTDNNNAFVCDKVIEGVGQINAGLEGMAILSLSEFWKTLLCYSYNGQAYVPGMDACQFSPVEEQCQFSVGMAELGSAVELEIFPNPAGQHITIRSGLPGEADIIVRDAAQRIVITEKCYNAVNMQLDINLPAGAYFVQVQGKQGRSAVRKLIVQ
jgi:hypothetical protein